jgi:hypothetical protein
MNRVVLGAVTLMAVWNSGAARAAEVSLIAPGVSGPPCSS